MDSKKSSDGGKPNESEKQTSGNSNSSGGGGASFTYAAIARKSCSKPWNYVPQEKYGR